MSQSSIRGRYEIRYINKKGGARSIEAKVNIYQSFVEILDIGRGRKHFSEGDIIPVHRITKMKKLDSK